MERSDRAAQRPVRRNYGAAQRPRSARARSASVTAATFVARVSHAFGWSNPMVVAP